MAEAENIFKSVFQNPELSRSTFLYALARENFSRVYFLKQNYDETIKLLKEGEEKIKAHDYKELKIKIYEGLAKAYLAKNNLKEYEIYSDLASDLKQDIVENRKNSISYLVSIDEGLKKDELNFSLNKYSENTRMIAIFCAVFLLVFGILYFLTYQKENELNKRINFFENYYKRLNKDSKSAQAKITVTEATKVSEKDDKPSKVLAMSPEKENQLLEKLNDFEDSKLFLSNQMSLPVLAAELGTNIKYLSQIIRDNKDKKFNAYINDLRIQHVVKLLQTEPAYLNYKVSYLAEISGFSSHSAFAAIFKSITGMSPNEFIQQISQSK